MQGKEGFSKHAHLKISWIKHQISPKDGFLNYPPPSIYGDNSNFTKESSPSSSSGFRISPALLFVIVILSILFFISGVLHLLVRFLTKCPSHSQSNRNNFDSSSDPNDALQRQLQQLFHLNDSGLDQAFIDLLPLFSYEEILGPKEPFDCAVCLCEFSQTDRLRLLPTCSHAFHKNCVDTWLLSNSTCPICRRTLLDSLGEYSVFGYDGIKEEEKEEEQEEEKNLEIEEVSPKKGVFQVRLGKFRKLNDAEWKEEDGSSSSRIDARRCYSMGSYQYVVGDSDLRVALRREGDGGDSDFDGGSSIQGKKICNGAKIDSYSVSKIWLWSKKGKFATSCEDQSENIQSSPNLDLTWMHRTRGI